MKIYRLFIPVILFMAACFLMSCASHQAVVLTEKPAPRSTPEVPEIGRQAALKTTAYPTKPVVMQMIQKARRQMVEDHLGNAFSTLERALKIDPSDPMLWHLLAETQLRQGNYEQAEQLAKKSNLLAGNDKRLKNQNRLIISKALKQRGASN